MKIEPATYLRSPRPSLRAARRFFSLADIIAREHEPTPTQLRALESSYVGTGNFLCDCPELKGDLVQIHPHGSRELGTMVRPRDDSRTGFDIDLIAQLSHNARYKYAGEHGPQLLLEGLSKALARYASAHGLRYRLWERCVTLEYAEGMHADVAPVIDEPLFSAAYGDSHAVIPDSELRTFNATNPRGYSKHFAKLASISPVFTNTLSGVPTMDSLARADVAPLPEAQDVFERLLCRLVQLMKLHRNVAFGKASTGLLDLAPSSVFVTTLAALSYAEMARIPHDSPMDLLLDVVENMFNCFTRVPSINGTEHWELANPSAPGDNLADSMNEPRRQAAFLQWHAKLVEDLKRILQAIEQHEGMDVLFRVIESAFGARSSAAVRRDQLEQSEKSRSAGIAKLVIAGAAAPVSVSARPHTFFGD